MSAPDTSAARPYTIIGTPVHENRWVEEAQAVVSGWTIRARWHSTNTVIPVFVPDTADLSATADNLIRYHGAQLDKLLGG